MIDEIDPKLDQALASFAASVAEDLPDLAAVLARVQSGDVGELGGIQAMLEQMAKNPKLEGQLQRIAMRAFAPIRGESEGAEVPAKPNPLAVAALAERLQFDGDVPELRHGDTTSGQRLAVPVALPDGVTNPVAIGKMLAAAEAQVGAELAAGREIRRLDRKSVV